MVRARRIAAAGPLLEDPGAAEWRRLPPDVLSLGPTPLASQPSLYIQASWQERRYGALPELAVQAAHNGDALFFRLAWADPTEDVAPADTDGFTDAAVVLFPLKDDAPLTSMGSPGLPVNGWYWRADVDEALNVTAQGTGTSARHRGTSVGARAAYADGGWTVVLWRPFAEVGKGSVRLAPGQKKKVAFGVWQGSNQERAGLKAVTLEWQPLDIEE